MLRRSMAIGSVLAAVLVAVLVGGCSSNDTPTKPQALCEKIGIEALRKLIPDFQPEAPGEGESTACVRLASGSGPAPGDFLRITIDGASPGTEAECATVEREDSGATLIPADELRGVGDLACGNVTTDENKGVVVVILARRGETHVTITFGRTPGDATAVRAGVVELARTVMQRV